MVFRSNASIPKLNSITGGEFGAKTSPAALIPSRLRRVIDEVVGEKLFENVKSSFPLNLFGISADDGFRRI
jgi:hypothetical protein